MSLRLHLKKTRACRCLARASAAELGRFTGSLSPSVSNRFLVEVCKDRLRKSLQFFRPFIELPAACSRAPSRSSSWAFSGTCFKACIHKIGRNALTGGFTRLCLQHGLGSRGRVALEQREATQWLDSLQPVRAGPSQKMALRPWEEPGKRFFKSLTR